VGNPLTNDFMATLDTGNRQVVVLLNSGMTVAIQPCRTLRAR